MAEVETFAADFFGESFETLGAPSAAVLADLTDVDDQSWIEAVFVARAVALDVLADEADVARFKQVARKNRASVDDFFMFAQAATKAATERPTVQPSDSSDGPTVTEPKSDVNSDGNVSRLHGRPDKRLAIRLSAVG